MPQNIASISLFLPAFNDERTIGTLVEAAIGLLDSLTSDYEVIVINDASTDSTGQVLDQLASTSPRVRIIHHPRNLGYGGALRTGFSTATKELIFYTDGDGQYDLTEISNLLPLMTDDVDVVNGYKIKRQDNFGREIAGALYGRFARLLFRIPIRDVDCDFRLIRRRALQRVTLASNSGAICVELVHKLCVTGSTFREVPVSHLPRLHGRSQFFKPARIAKTIFDVFRLWWSERVSSQFFYDKSRTAVPDQ